MGDGTSKSAFTLGEALLETIAHAPDAGITFVDKRGQRDFMSYRALHEGALSDLGRLQAAGLAPGSIALLQLSSTRRHLQALWACILGRYLSITVARAPSYRERNSVTDKLHNVWRRLERPWVVTDSERESELRAAFALYGEERVELAVLDRMASRSSATPLPARAEDVVFLQLTSGSTGVPKAIQITHRGILAHANAARVVNRFSDRDTSLNWLAMDHVAPVLTYHFKDVIVGSHQVHVDMEWILGDPLRWLDLIDEFRITHSWSPNFGYKLLTEAHTKRLAREKTTWDLTCLKQLMNAGEQVTMAVIRPFCDAFRPYGLHEAVMQPAFGMAESCTAITYNNDFSLDSGSEVCGSVGGVGKPLRLDGQATASFVDCGSPLPGVELRIASVENCALGDDVCGRVQLRGAVITPGYLDNPEANAEAFVGDGWFNTGDLGFVRGGHLFLVGREKETIIVRGANFFCYELEEHVSGRVGVLDTFVAATSIADADAGTEQLLLFFVPDGNYLPGITESDVAQSVSAAFGVIPHAVLAVARGDFAKTTSGKIQRTQMRARYLADELRPRLGHEPLAERVFVPLGISTPNLSGMQTRHAVLLGSAASAATQLPFGKLTRVERGASFARAAHAFTLDPTCEADYGRLFEALAEVPGPVTLIFAWDFGGEASWLDAVVPLARALVAAHGGGRLALDELVLVGEHFLRSGGESSVNVHAEVAAAYLKAACLELAGLRYRVIDFSGYPHARRHSALLAELCDPLGQAEPLGREVACRDAGHLVARTISSRIDNGVLFQTLAFELEAGTIVISGGLGGLGKRLAHDLLRHVPAARIALFGRSAHKLQPQDWPELSPANFARLAYHQADFSDAPAVLHALGETPVSALFHLAGVSRNCPAADESLHEVAAVVAPKAGAEVTLRAIAARHPRCLIFATSSSMGHLVEPGLVAYAAANRGLEAAVEALRKEGKRAFAVVLGAFDHVGMNDDAEALAYQCARGYRLLSAEHLFDACRLAYAYPGRTFMFGAPPVDASLEPRLSSEADSPIIPRLRELLEIFATTTGCAADTHRTYFELGADSLKLTRFRQAVEAKLGIDLPASTLYRRNTLAQLCDELSAAPVDAEGSASVPLIKLVSGTDPEATPLLLIPPAGGVIAPYEKLIAALPHVRDIWGFEDPCIHDSRGKDWELDALLDVMVEWVASKISRPPVVLSYSGGGFVAWALTHRLNQRGLPPPLLVLVDTYLIEHPYRLADAVHPISMGLDRGAPGAIVRALFHSARALNVPFPRTLREAASRSKARRNTTFQCLYETQRYYHGWKHSLSSDALSRESFDDALDVACELVRREDPDYDSSRLRKILTHACVVTPRRMLAFAPERLPNQVAVFEVEKGKLTIKNLLESYTDNIIHHEHIAVPCYATLDTDYFRFTHSASAVKHFLCMYDEHFVVTLAARVSALIQRTRTATD